LRHGSIFETKEANSTLLKFLRSLRVSFLLGRRIVHAAINFYAKPLFSAVEIQYKPVNAVLASKL
jgi:hypothetical protein